MITGRRGKKTGGNRRIQSQNGNIDVYKIEISMFHDIDVCIGHLRSTNPLWSGDGKHCVVCQNKRQLRRSVSTAPKRLFLRTQRISDRVISQRLWAGG